MEKLREIQRKMVQAHRNKMYRTERLYRRQIMEMLEGITNG